MDWSAANGPEWAAYFGDILKANWSELATQDPDAKTNQPVSCT